jgi:2-polyprenyl-6-methoxyphenol hydroxylase-like FAD-dependent oxidoreductase
MASNQSGDFFKRKSNILDWCLQPDVIVIGAGPVGCVAALSFARKGVQVLLLEANPEVANRLAGEWLHPPGLEVLERLGISEISTLASAYPNGKGFVVFLEKNTLPIYLNYPDKGMGLSCEHRKLVNALRKTAITHPNIHFIPFARVTRIEGQQVIFEKSNQRKTQKVLAKYIVSADGRASLSRKMLGINSKPALISYMSGIQMQGVELPFEGFGHMFLGGPGPVLVYRIGEQQVRACFDVPASHFRKVKNKTVYLWDVYSPVLPDVLLPAFRQALLHQSIKWCVNEFSYRIHYGREGFALVGDATGYFHPLTAMGMTLGFKDAECLANSKKFRDFERERLANTYVPELVTSVLYRVFTGHDENATAIRQAVYQMCRQEPAESHRTMRLLSTAETNLLQFIGSFSKGSRIAVTHIVKNNAAKRRWLHMIKVLVSFGEWLELPMKLAWIRFASYYCFSTKQLKNK